MHRLVREPDGTTTLYIGAKNWPTPIPLVQKGQLVVFRYRRGQEGDFVPANRPERNIDHSRLPGTRGGGEGVSPTHSQMDMPQKILSDDGRHNGLYWKAAAGDPQSPIGPLVATAVAEGYADNGKEIAPTPYRGYYFHILTQQGKQAPGGAKSYIVNGKMTEGFAFVAYPAEYRSSGVMTFIVGSDGVVYEKDLGKETAVIAKAMKQYDPDTRWHRADGTQAETAREQNTP